ncbi:LysR family transcriptional regulator [Sunxiuqinia indica]|uniref:LysR family transcriptional regulator n=1 Tax=Sunxiuqinia indica TaxID=2692584 RepID=UPI00135A1547|nr:LysR family transcriptional regulator [Sunxiuqinia indica]
MKRNLIDGAVWFDMNDQGVKCYFWMQILCSIKSTGSISGTAQDLGTSYSKIYNEIERLNCAAGKKMIVSGRGGIGGGFAELTEEALQIVRVFNKAQKQFNQFIVEMNQNLEPFF